MGRIEPAPRMLTGPGGVRAPSRARDNLAAALSRASFDGIYVAEPVRDARGRPVDFRIVDVNAMAAAQFARTRESLVGLLLSEGVADREVSDEAIEVSRRAIERGVVIEDELPAPPELSPLWIARRVVPMADRVVVAVRDVGDAHRERGRRSLAGVRALARAEEAKDPSTRRHSERVADLAAILARALDWDEDRMTALREAALIHDVGKIGVPDGILLKPGRLRPEEYEIAKRHVSLSADIASEVLDEEQVSWIRAHHERWDGDGYPEGLTGAEIPQGARILALVDAWDVMTHRRPYAVPMSVDRAREEIVRQRGRHFAPEVVDAFLDLDVSRRRAPLEEA